MPKSNEGFYTRRKQHGSNRVVYWLWSDYEDRDRGYGPEFVMSCDDVVNDNGPEYVLDLQYGRLEA